MFPPSCDDAIKQIPQLKNLQVFQTRGLGIYDVPLPSRYIGGDGLCIVDIGIKEGARSDRATLDDINRAARGIFYDCVAKDHRNGSATGIATFSQKGENKALEVVVTPYNPKVQCIPRPQPVPNQNCMRIIDHMRTGRVELEFANANDRYARRADVKLPKYMYESSHECMGVIHTMGGADSSSWYEIWEALVTIVGVCMRYNYWGMAFGRGME
ncbi:MAG: hypothetical protein Q9219_007396 [cf. Caloplaca sp. 3 TL-2023]